jgi:plastocyanin
MKRDIVCFLVAAAFLTTAFWGSTVSSAQDTGWGDLTGQILVDGEAPENPPEDLAGNKDREVCLVDGEVPLDDGILVGNSNGLKDVFVMMYLSRRDKGPEKYHPDYEKLRNEKLTIDNIKCRFVPKSTFARPGQTLILKNSDEVGHNCHITTFEHEYNPNIPPKKQVEVKLDDAVV